MWLSSKVLGDAEIKLLRERDIELSIFDYEIDPADSENLDCALQTIQEHHPGQKIWFE